MPLNWLWDCHRAMKFTVTFLLRTTRMCSQLFGRVSGVAVLQTNKQTIWMINKLGIRNTLKKERKKERTNERKALFMFVVKHVHSLVLWPPPPEVIKPHLLAQEYVHTCLYVRVRETGLVPSESALDWHITSNGHSFFFLLSSTHRAKCELSSSAFEWHTKGSTKPISAYKFKSEAT